MRHLAGWSGEARNGFPYPNEDHTSVKFLETPATVWGAESVLIDEISRCKPEHQNRVVQSGAGECLVRVAYAPNMADPLEVSWEMTGRGERVPQEFFRHDAMIRRYRAAAIGPALARGRHFYDERLPWNRGGLDDDRG